MLAKISDPYFDLPLGFNVYARLLLYQEYYTIRLPLLTILSLSKTSAGFIKLFSSNAILMAVKMSLFWILCVSPLALALMDPVSEYVVHIFETTPDDNCRTFAIVVFFITCFLSNTTSSRFGWLVALPFSNWPPSWLMVPRLSETKWGLLKSYFICWYTTMARRELGSSNKWK